MFRKIERIGKGGSSNVFKVTDGTGLVLFLHLSSIEIPWFSCRCRSSFESQFHSLLFPPQATLRSLLIVTHKFRLLFQVFALKEVNLAMIDAGVLEGYINEAKLLTNLRNEGIIILKLRNILLKTVS